LGFWAETGFLGSDLSSVLPGIEGFAVDLVVVGFLGGGATTVRGTLDLMDLIGLGITFPTGLGRLGNCPFDKFC